MNKQTNERRDGKERRKEGVLTLENNSARHSKNPKTLVIRLPHTKTSPYQLASPRSDSMRNGSPIRITKGNNVTADPKSSTPIGLSSHRNAGERT